MIRYSQGDLLDDPSEALVNTVNCVGVMGKGVALAFRGRFPWNTIVYERACRAKEVRVGRMLVVRGDGLWEPKWVINFPTKNDWRHPSRLEWVVDGLRDLVRVVRENGIGSVALPALGCGNGGLKWPLVRAEIESALSDLAGVTVTVYAPAGATGRRDFPGTAVDAH